MERIRKISGTILLAYVTVLMLALGFSMLTQETRKKSSSKFAVNSHLYPYVMDFKFTLEREGIDVDYRAQDLVKVSFNNAMPYSILGVAWGMNIDNVVVIDINFVAWKYLSHDQKRLLIFHELGHDVFNLRHFSTEVMRTPFPLKANKLYVDSAIKDLIQYLKENKRNENSKRHQASMAEYLECRY